MSNIFRHTPDGSLDRQYLRICAVYRLLKRGQITSKARAVELLAERKVKTARATVEVWMTGAQMRHVTLTA